MNQRLYKSDVYGIDTTFWEACLVLSLSLSSPVSFLRFLSISWKLSVLKIHFKQRCIIYKALSYTDHASCINMFSLLPIFLFYLCSSKKGWDSWKTPASRFIWDLEQLLQKLRTKKYWDLIQIMDFYFYGFFIWFLSIFLSINRFHLVFF